MKQKRIPIKLTVNFQMTVTEDFYKVISLKEDMANERIVNNCFLNYDRLVLDYHCERIKTDRGNDRRQGDRRDQYNDSRRGLDRREEDQS